MINPTQDSNNFLKYFTQKKQRIDLYIDMSTQTVKGFTKLIFTAKPDIKDEIPEFLSFFLNCENMAINSVKLDKSSKISEESIDQGGRDGELKNIEEKKKLISLEYKNTSPSDYNKYLDELYKNIEDSESFKNLNRIEWEIRKKGNLVITIPKKEIIDNNDKDITSNDIAGLMMIIQRIIIILKKMVKI